MVTTTPSALSAATGDDRTDSVAPLAFMEGMLNGVFTTIPTIGAVTIALKRYPKFAKFTNWQSRTAIMIMPGMFVFAYTAEMKVNQKIRENKIEVSHAHDTVQWAEAELVRRNTLPSLSHLHLTELYEQSVENSGFRVVPGDRLSMTHQLANFVVENPFKVAISVAVPAVAAVYYGQTGNEHLSFSRQLLNTRVMGQFATLSLLLSIMGFRNYMESHGKYITQTEMEERVEEMHRVRANLLHRLEAKQEAQEQAQEDAKPKKRKRKKKKQPKLPVEEVVVSA